MTDWPGQIVLLSSSNEGNLELTDVDDLCVPRKIEFRGKLSDADTLQQTIGCQPSAGRAGPRRLVGE